MTISRINCFLAVAECGSFSRAAEKLFISQPAVSKQVSALEEEYGFPLFVRVRGGVGLTAEGEIMQELFSRFGREYAAAVTHARSLARRETVRIGWLEGWDMSLFYNSIVEHFAQKFPNLRLDLEGYSFADMMPAIKRGDVDMLISLGSSLRDHAELETAELTTTGGVIIFSREHPLADKPGLCWEDFKNEVFFSINEPDGAKNTSGFTRSECRRHGFEPEILNVPSVTNAFLKMQSNNGVFFVDDWIAIRSSPQMRYINVDSTFDIAVGWLRNGCGETARRVIDELIGFFHERFER